MTSLIINLPMAEFYRQSLSCEVINKSQGDINSNSNYFPMYARCSISIARLFFEVSTSIFCMLIWPRQSPWHFTPFVFESSLRQSYDPSWKLQSCALPGWFQSSNHLSKPPPRAIEPLRIVCFRNFSLHAHAPPTKTPLAPSSACFITRLFFLKASSSSYLVQICPHQSLRTVCFETPLTGTILA